MWLAETLKMYRNKEEYENVFKRTYEKAIEGYHVAQYFLGKLYNRGHGVEADQKESFKWFLKAAEQGDADAQIIVGMAYSGYWTPDDTKVFLTYEERKIYDEIPNTDYKTYYWRMPTPAVEKDRNMALYWFFKAFDTYQYKKAGDRIRLEFESLNMDIHISDDEYNCYNDKISRLTQENVDKFITFYKKIYEASHNGKYVDYIGMLYENKNGDFHNYEEAAKWYKIGHTEYKSPISAYRLGGLYMNGSGVERKLFLGLAHYDFAFERGFNKDWFDGYYYIGKAAQEGDDTLIQADETAIQAFIYGSDINDRLSEKCLKEYYDKGYSVGDKYNNKFLLLDKAQAGDIEARKEFINLYVKTEDSYMWDSYKWLIEFADKGDHEAVKILFSLFYDFFDFSRERDKEAYHAFKLWLAENGDADYQYRLGLQYESGYYGKDIQKALYWFNRAATNNVRASEKLNYRYYLTGGESESTEEYDEPLTPVNSIDAIIHLGYGYAHGNFGAIDYLKAYNYYQEAANQLSKIKYTENYDRNKLVNNLGNEDAKKEALSGDINAMLYKGCLYQHGFEVDANKNKAKYWYEMAAKSGSVEAKSQISNFK